MVVAIAVGRAPSLAVERDRCGADQIVSSSHVRVMTAREGSLFGPHVYEIVYGWSTRSLEVTISADSGPPLARGDVCTIGGQTGYCKDFIVIEVKLRDAGWSARCVSAGEEIF